MALETVKTDVNSIQEENSTKKADVKKNVVVPPTPNNSQDLAAQQNGMLINVQ